MIALLQRVRSASVALHSGTAGAIEEGLLIFLGVHESDTTDVIEWLARKCVNLRIFPDENGKMNRSVLDHGGEILVVSQFTLYGNAQKGNRPSFTDSARAPIAEPLYQAFCSHVSDLLGKKVERGEFGAMMEVSLINWGPVTLSIERRNP